MKKQRTEIRKQRTEIREQRSERIEDLLRQAVPPVEDHAESGGDLWPAMLRKLRAESAPAPAKVGVPWFDWALAGGLAVLVGAFPAAIPVLLYYL
jgi:hypothetical protein